MGIVFRQSVKGTIINFSGALLGVIVTYLSTRWLTQQEWGFTRNLLVQAVVGSQFVLIGMHTTLFVFIHRYAPGDPRRPVLITLSMLIPLGITILASIFYLSFQSSIIALYQPQDIIFIKKYFTWLPLYVLLWGYMTLLEQYLCSQMKIAISVFIREVILRILNIGLLCGFVLQVISFEQFVIAGVLVHIIPIILLWMLARKTETFHLSFNWGALARTDYKAIIDFALFHLLLNVSVSMLGYIDTLMLPALDKKGMESVAVYSVAVLVISIFYIPYKALAGAATPVLNKAYESKDRAKVENLFKRSGINILIVSLGMALLIALNMDNVALIFGARYEAIKMIVWILLLGRVIDMTTGLNNEILSVSEYYRISFYLTVTLLVMVITFNYFLIPIYGVYGAAWGVTLSLGIFNIAKLAYVKWKLGLTPFTPKSLYVLFGAGVTGLVVYYIPFLYNPFADAMIRSSLIVVLYGGMLVWIQPSDDLKEYFSSIKKNKKLF